MIGYPKPEKKKKRKSKSASERSKLIKECDRLVTDILFTTRPHECVTCHIRQERFHPINNSYGLQCGHYITRTVFPLRWNLKNCNLQCSRCNFNHENNILPYTIYMVKTYGEDTLQEFDLLVREYKQKAKTMPTTEIREIYQQLTSLKNVDR